MSSAAIMTYDEITEGLVKDGFFTHHCEDNGTLVCSSAEWPNVPQEAHSFWVAKRDDGWYVGTWAPRLIGRQTRRAFPLFVSPGYGRLWRQLGERLTIGSGVSSN